MTAEAASVVAVSRSTDHGFGKTPCPQIQLIAGIGIEGDAHAGATVQHSCQKKDGDTAPNLRQVHLIPGELLDELSAAGFSLAPGDIGENFVTRSVDLLALPRGARLHMGDAAVIEITGLRSPCRQLDEFQKGLMSAMIEKRADGGVIRKSGIMGIVIEGGVVRPGDPIRVERPAAPHEALAPV